MRTLKSKREFGEVFSKGTRAQHPLVRVTYLRSDGEEGKLAFVAAKRLGNAVFRNRCKRVLREAARMIDLPMEGYSMILFATGRTHGSHPEEVGKALERIFVSKHLR